MRDNFGRPACCLDNPKAAKTARLSADTERYLCLPKLLQRNAHEQASVGARKCSLSTTFKNAAAYRPDVVNLYQSLAQQSAKSMRASVCTAVITAVC